MRAQGLSPVRRLMRVGPICWRKGSTAASSKVRWLTKSRMASAIDYSEGAAAAQERQTGGEISTNQRDDVWFPQTRAFSDPLAAPLTCAGLTAAACAIGTEEKEEEAGGVAVEKSRSTALLAASGMGIGE